MKVVVIGGVAAGTKVAAKLMREDRANEVLILNKGENISYAGCGLPYYVGHVIEEKEALIVNTPEKYEALTGVKVQTKMEVIHVDAQGHKVVAKNTETGEETGFDYDKLVVATGASPIKPTIPGIDLENVFFMRTPEDAITLRELIDAGNVKKAVVVGAGYIGLEIAENLKSQGVRPFVLDMAPHVLPGFDEDMAELVERKLMDAGIPVVTGVTVTGIEGEGHVEKVITDKRAYKADLVVMSAGIRPNTAFLEDTGIEMIKGTIVTNEKGETSLQDVYAAGDCAMVQNRITGKPAWSPMGSTANIFGRIVAQNMMGADLSYSGVLGTAVCQLPGMNVGRTGLTEVQAKEEGFDVISVVTAEDDKAHYMPGAGVVITKLVADAKSRRLLGLQVVGGNTVDKMVDIAVTGISLKGTVDQMADMDLAYAPPFSTAIHPIAHTLNVLINKMDGKLNSFTPAEYLQGKTEGYKVIDTCMVPSIEGAEYIDVVNVTGPIDEWNKDDKMLLVCNKGRKAYLLQNRLKALGYNNTMTLEGGIAANDVEL